MMHGEKVTIYDNKVIFIDAGVVFMFKGNIFSLITNYNFLKTDSSDAKQFTDFLD